MEGTMRVVIMIGKKKIEWCKRGTPQSGPGELQIKPEHVGVCGPDLCFYLEGHLVNWVPDGSLVSGHEPDGVVSAVGEDVTGLEIGDRVAPEPGVPCDHCESCLKGHYNLRRSARSMVIPGEKDGVFSEYCTHVADMTFKPPGNVSTMGSGFMGPLAVSMHACGLSNAKLGETAVVLGVGCIGLVALMPLKARGISEIYVADVLGRYPEKVREPGATRMLNSRNENIEEFVKILPGDGADQVYEYAGDRITTFQICRLIRKAGEITLVDVSPGSTLELDIAMLNAMEGTIYSVYRHRDLYPSTISAVSKGLIPLRKIVPHTFDFKDIIEGVDYSLSHKDEVIKVVIRMQRTRQGERLKAYLVRHGEMEWNYRGKVQGQADIPLNKEGEALTFLAG